MSDAYAEVELNGEGLLKIIKTLVQAEMCTLLMAKREEMLAQGELYWAAVLSQFIGAMTDEAFWQGATIEPSAS